MLIQKIILLKLFTAEFPCIKDFSYGFILSYLIRLALSEKSYIEQKISTFQFYASKDICSNCLCLCILYYKVYNKGYIDKDSLNKYLLMHRIEKY